MGTQNTRDDKRALIHEALEDIRISTVRRVREAGESPEDLARILDFSRTAVYNWLRAYDAGGIDALRAKPVPGRPSRVTDDQLDWVRAIILETSPLDWRFETTLWTRRMVVEMIESLYGVSYSEESAGRLMRQKMGLSPQRPVRRAAEQDPEAVRPGWWRSIRRLLPRRVMRGRRSISVMRPAYDLTIIQEPPGGHKVKRRSLRKPANALA